SSVTAGISLALITDAHTIFDSGGNRHRDEMFRCLPPVSLTLPTRVFDNAARSSTYRAGTCDGKKSLLKPHLSTTRTLLADSWPMAWFRAAALARGAIFHSANF